MPPSGQIPEFGLDTSIIYSFGEFKVEEKKVNGECALTLKGYRQGEVVIMIMLHYPSYDFSMSWYADKIKLDYDDEEFSDEILEINERIFRIKRSSFNYIMSRKSLIKVRRGKPVLSPTYEHFCFSMYLISFVARTRKKRMEFSPFFLVT